MQEIREAVSRGHVVVVDDDELFCESVGRNLLDAGYRIRAFSNGPAAIQEIPSIPEVDLILLDWKMPDMTGIDVLQHLRRSEINIPVIFLTVLTDQIYEEAALLGGAVDFIEKSRSFSILLRRIELILEGNKLREVNQTKNTDNDVLQHGYLTIRHDSCRCLWKEMELGLTLTEFKILVHLVENRDHDISYREIYNIVHGEGFHAGDGNLGYRTNVRAFVKRIRKKFKDVDAEFIAINNYPSFGYRWRDESTD